MSIALDFNKLISSGNVTLAYYPSNAFADFKAPTAAELNAASPSAAQFSKSISWNDLDFGLQASNQIDDPSIADRGNFQTRGAAQYGGGISFYFPGAFDDNSNAYSLTYDAISTPRTTGYIVARIDGAKTPGTAFAEGDLVHVMEITTDGQTHAITGEEAFRYTVNFLQRGALAVYTVVQGTVNSPVVVTGNATPAAGNIFRVKGTVAGREYTNGLVWTTSAPTVATVSSAGVVTIVGSSMNTATITGTFAATGASGTLSITVA